MEGSVPFGISVPSNTPQTVVVRLNAAFNEAMSDPVTRRKLSELGFVPIGGRPQDYAALLANEIAKWRKLIKDSKIPAPS
jgi:tripartite-type tricarboxylate transporter receptor subunit TctC